MLLNLLRCASCGQGLVPHADVLRCAACSAEWAQHDNVPNLLPQAGSDASVGARIQAFYEQTPFPNYDAIDSPATLMDKARQGLLARLLDEQQPLGTRILDAGCGTGQLTNFLAIANRETVGVDLSRASLQLAEAFRARHGLHRARFLQASLFDPVLEPASFDLVISNGVLHHTPDPKGGLVRLRHLVRPGGYLAIGLYHRYGRLFTNLRQRWFRATGGALKGLDPRNVDRSLSPQRRDAWYLDQYHNPHESTHTVTEVQTWLKELNLIYIRALPLRRWIAETTQPKLFEPESVRDGFAARGYELSMALRPSQIREGGFFVVVAQVPQDSMGDRVGA